MFICDECKNSFAEPKKVCEPHGELWDSCRYCGSFEVESADVCNICGEYFNEFDLEEGLCDACAKNAVRRLRELLFEYFEEVELNFLNWHFDGRELWRR